MTLVDIDNLGPAEIAALLEKAAAAIRAGGATAAAPMVPVQLDLIQPLPPIDKSSVDLNERLPDGNKRWISLEAASQLLDCKRDAALEKVKKAGAAIQIGEMASPWRIDRLRLVGVIRTTFP